MKHLGHTRSVHGGSHCLWTPDTYVRAPLPGMKNATAIVHISPACGAGFTQYTAEIGAGGRLGRAIGQRFIYVLEGSITLSGGSLDADQFAYVPADFHAFIDSDAGARVLVIEKIWAPLAPGVSEPRLFAGNERLVEPVPLSGDSSIQVRALIPDDSAFDFAVNTMTYEPGAALPMVEIHVMEHGLLMLNGGGIYRLDDSWYPVTAGDFIWMAPYCPQWFGALGKTPARYIIYKDWNRHPLHESANQL